MKISPLVVSFILGGSVGSKLLEWTAEVALVGDVELAREEMREDTDSLRLRCSALLSIVLNEVDDALHLMRQAEALEKNGSRGGCPGLLQTFFYSSAFSLMRLRDARPTTALLTCDEQVIPDVIQLLIIRIFFFQVWVH